MTHDAEKDALRKAVADMIRDHTMPPNKDQYGYDYRMGWWDAVTYLDSLVKHRVRQARATPPAVGDDGCRCGGYCEHGVTPPTGGAA